MGMDRNERMRALTVLTCEHQASVSVLISCVIQVRRASEKLLHNLDPAVIKGARKLSTACREAVWVTAMLCKWMMVSMKYSTRSGKRFRWG